MVSTNEPLTPSEDRDFLVWLRSVEKRAILPLKWAILATTFLFWMLSRPNAWPMPVGVFALFIGYFMYNVGQSYLFWFSRTSLAQVRPVAVVSYCVDVLFITLLVYLDQRRMPGPGEFATDFYVFYFLLILRGFALFRSPSSNLMANSIIGAIFIGSMVLRDSGGLDYDTRTDMIRIVFVWLVILMSWFIVEVINQQNQEILRARENLLQSENLATLGQLAAGVAHEINNPIGIISAYAEYLRKKTPDDDPRAEDLESIHREALRCKRIVEELLNYARPARQESEPVDLRDLSEEVLAFTFKRQEGREIKVVKKFPGDIPPVAADKGLIKQALLNLFLNAQDAMADEGGTLTVEASHDPELQSVRLRVSDTGGGIDSGVLRRVFDPFFTTRPKGTGLGLSITRRIIESHGGTIEIASLIGEGTTVTIVLPRAGKTTAEEQ